MTDQELDAVRRITPEIAARYLQHYHTAQDIRYYLRSGDCPFGYAVQRKRNWIYRISPAHLKQYKNGLFPVMRPIQGEI